MSESKFKILEDVKFELRLVSIHHVPGTTEKEEGIVWRFGVSSRQLSEISMSYPPPPVVKER